MKRYKLTLSQEAILLESLADPARYVTVLRYTLSEPMTAETLARRVQLLSQRHEALRTVFVRDNDGVFWQEISDGVDERLFKAEVNGDELTVKFHHALFDGWSISVLMRELLEEPSGKASPFRYYVKWLEARNQADDMTWWAGYLGGKPVCSGPPNNTKPDGYERRGLWFELENSARVKSVAKELRITAGRLIQAVWCMLIARYNGGESVVCTVNSGRSAPVPGITGMAGMCVNTLPIVTKLPENAAFADWVREWGNRTAEAEKHGFCALGDLVNGTMPHIFSIEPPFDGDGYRLKSSSAALVTDFDAVFALGDKIRCEFAYNAFAYSAQEVKAIQGHFLTALNAVLADPQICVESIPILTDAEISELTAINEDRRLLDIIERKTLVDFWRESVKLYANRTAIVCGGVRLSYAEVSETAGRLCAALQARGVRAGIPVAILLSRSERYIIAELAVMQSGGVFVPLDTEWPDERIKTILTEIKPPLVIDEEMYACFAREDTAPSVSDPSPRNAAYMIMTSGTTGAPKGVVIKHRSLTHYCLWVKERYGWGDYDASALELGFSFDGSFWSIWPPLMSGGTVHVLTEDIRFDLKALGQYCRNERITHLDLPVTMAEAFREIYPALPDLRAMVTGGEEVRRVVDADYPLSNEYGPTECTIGCTAAWLDSGSPITIGEPLPNMHVYILDDRGRLCPDGVMGEACFAGVQTARGYYNASELTAERFIANPFSDAQDYRTMYRTGDLMKYVRRGGRRELVFMGRVDNQVKLSGFRVELGEVESVLRSHPAVSTAVAALKGGKLTAVVVPCGDVCDLGAFIESKLPRFMIPAIILVDSIPLTSSGKVDFDGLPEVQDDHERTPPSTEAEKALVTAVSRALSLDDIGTNDNYTALGGNSINAMRISFGLESGGWTLAAKDLITSKTLAEAAGKMSVSIAEGAGVFDSRMFTPLPAQRAMMFLTATEGADMYAVTLTLDAAGLNEDELKRRLSKAARLHDILRTEFESDRDGRVYGRVYDTCRPAVECVLRDGELKLSYHHIALDGHSAGLLVNELLHNHFPETAPSFAEFANRMMSDEARRAADERWWRARCRNAIAAPLFAPKADAGEDYRRIEFCTPELLSRCAEAARNARVTAAAFALTAWGLTAIGAENEILLPFTASCRDDENLMGMCAAAMPLIFQMTDGGFGELARHTQAAMLECVSHWLVPQDIISGLPKHLFVFEDEGGFAASGRQNYDLIVKFSDLGELIYNAARLPEADAQTIAKRLNAALTAAVEDRVSVFLPGEYELVTKTLAQGKRLSVTRNAAEAFCAAAARYAERVALEAEDGTLTYSELLGRAREYAQGLSPGDIVDFCLPRGMEAIVAHVGIALSGAAFLPLDPEWPEDRRGGILGETRSAKVPPDTAYVLYTSGTTGKPKGVMIPQAALANQIAWAVDEFGLAPGDKVLHYVSFTFDPSVWTIFAALCSGAELSLLPEAMRLDPGAVARHIREKGITVCVLPAAVASGILSRVGESKLRLALLGGEAVKNIPGEALGCEIVNCYGPTEACVNAAFYRLPRGKTETRDIGKPVANTECYVLDARGEPCPVGVRGELYIGGVQLAHGYLNRPEESAAAFIEHPRGRLYKTGDYVMWNADGTLAFLGRGDNQVKIRGNRVELSEIEHALCDLPGVSDAKVRLSGGCVDAYIIGNAPNVRQALAKRLPSYMLPRSVTVIDAFPLTENGKVNFAALPDPVREDVSDSSLTETEQAVAAAWKSALRLSPEFIIKPGDSFNELGGHSLLLFHVVGLLAASCVMADIKTLIDYPVLRDLAAAIDTRTSKLAAKAALTGTANTEGYQAYVQSLKELDLSVERGFDNILITGGTGFLGSHLVREFYANTGAVIYVPVRGDTVRLKDALRYYFGDLGAEMSESSRIRAFVCDLSEAPPDIGADLDAIFHAAADIRHYAPEREMFCANVTATEHMLTLARRNPETLFAHISTTSAVNLPVMHETDTDLGPEFDNIYQRTKQLAERRVLDSGLRYAVFRVGHVSPGYESGSVSRNWEINAMLRLINSMLLTGLLPEKDYEIGYGYVDRAALAIRLLATPVNLADMIFHIDNPNAMRLSKIFRLAGLSGEVVPRAELITRLRGLSSSEDKPVAQAAAEYLGRLAQGSLEKDSIIQGKLYMDATLTLLERLGFVWPHLTAAYMQGIIRSLREGGRA